MKVQLAIILAAGAVVVAACTPDVNVTSDEVGGGGIAVSGRGEVSGTPDTLQMSFGVTVLRPSVEQALADASALANDLIATLEAEGVADEDIRTTNFSINPEYDFQGDQRRLLGYRVSNTVLAKVRDIDSAGAVIDAAAANVGDEIRVSGVSFSIEDDDDLIAAARAAAWEDARAKAQQLADLAGLTLGDAVSISETLVGAPPPVVREFAALSADGATPIEPGSQQVAVDLQVRFETTG